MCPSKKNILTYSKDKENLSAACSLRARAAASTGESCHLIMVATCCTVLSTLIHQARRSHVVQEMGRAVQILSSSACTPTMLQKPGDLGSV